MSGADSNVAVIAERLGTAGCVAAIEEAQELVASAKDEPTLEAWLCRREHGEPLAWITGRVSFCGQKLHVAPGVYILRTQTEELARRAAALLPAQGTAVDLCTGAGTIAAHLLSRVPTAAVIGVDIDERAATCARQNGVPTVVGDLVEPLTHHRGHHVVTAVAPYVPTGAMRLLPADVRRYEPHVALDGGADGLNLLHRVIAAAERLLRPGGWLLIEVGGHQDALLAPTLAAGRFDLVRSWRDDDGDLRGVACRASAAR